MLWIPLLAFVLVMAIAAIAYIFLWRSRGVSAEIKGRLSLLEVRRLAREDIPEVLKSELLSNVPSLNQVLARLDAAARIDRRLRQADVEMTVGMFVLLSVTLPAAALAAGAILHWPFVISVAAAAACAFIPRTVVNMKVRLRHKRFLGQFPDALEMFARSLRAGHSFTGAIQLVAQEMPDPVGQEFRKVFDEQNLGMPLREALVGMTDRVDILDVKFFVTAILIQRETGGNLAEIIDKISHVIRERFRVQGQLKIFTAQARMTGVILAGLPVGVAILIGMLNPDYLKPLWHEQLGKIMLVVAATLQVAGALVIRKIIRIKI